MRREDVPAKFRGLYDRALGGRNQAAAIRAHCLMCVGLQIDEVRQCIAPTCPLFPYRMTGRKAPKPPRQPQDGLPPQIRVGVRGQEGALVGQDGLHRWVNAAAGGRGVRNGFEACHRGV